MSSVWTEHESKPLNMKGNADILRDRKLALFCSVIRVHLRSPLNPTPRTEPRLDSLDSLHSLDSLPKVRSPKEFPKT